MSNNIINLYQEHQLILSILVGCQYFSWLDIFDSTSFFLGSKKRDIPDKNQRQGEDSKKLRKQIDSLSSLSNELFADGLHSPELAKLLVCSLRNIEDLVKDLFKVNKETKMSQIKLTESLDALSKKIDELETEIKK